MKNPNQDIIDIITLNKLRDANDNCVLSENEKIAMAKVIEREQRVRMNRIRLELTPDQINEVKKQENDLLKKCIG